MSMAEAGLKELIQIAQYFKLDVNTSTADIRDRLEVDVYITI
jgi:hypothetical protein